MKRSKSRPPKYHETDKGRIYIMPDGSNELWHIRVCHGAYRTQVFDCAKIENGKCTKCGKEFIEEAGQWVKK